MKPRIVGLVILAALAVWFLFLERAILAPFIMAAIFAYILNPVITFLAEKTKFPRTLFIAFLYILLFTFIGWLGTVLTRQILAEAEELSSQAQGFLVGADAQIYAMPIWFQDSARNAIGSLREALTIEPANLLPLFSGAASRIFTVITFLFASFYFLKDGGRFIDDILLFFSGERKLEVEILLRRINLILGNYLRGQLLIVLLMATLGFVLFTLLGVKYSLLLGIVIGLAEIIPMIGPIIAGVITVLVAALDGASVFGLDPIYDGALVLGGYVILNQIENYLIVPQIMGKVTKLHPLLVFFSVLAGGHLFGALGFILAVPVAASLRIILEYLLDKINAQ